MIAGTPVLDLDDAASLEAADSSGALRSAASGGAQVRATAAAVEEDILTRLDGLQPRSLLLVSGAGRATRAARLLVGALADRAGLPVVPVASVPPWVGPLDVVLVSGDDPADPRLVEAVDRAQRRGAEVVVAAPAEGPLRSVSAGRATILEPRVPVLDHNRLLRYLAASIAVLRGVDSRSRAVLPELAVLADALDAEALRNAPQYEVFHNPAKTLASRMQQRGVVLAGDSPHTTELAAHSAEVFLQSAGRVAAAVDLTVAVAALPAMVAGASAVAPGYDPLFHDDQLDGPPPVEQLRVFLLSTDTDVSAARRKLAVFAGAGAVDADLVSVGAAELTDAEPDESGQSTDPTDSAAGAGGELHGLAILALRLEMTAAYVRLMSSAEVASSSTDSHNGGRY